MGVGRSRTAARGSTASLTSTAYVKLAGGRAKHKFRTRALDNAGNESPWSPWSDVVDDNSPVEITATPDNTTSSSERFFTAGSKPPDNLWQYPFDYYQNRVPDWFVAHPLQEDAPVLVTTVGGLDRSKAYDVYVRVQGAVMPNYDRNTTRMGAMGAMSGEALQECTNYTAGLVDVVHLGEDGKPFMGVFEKKVGRVSGASSVKVEIDDGSGKIGTAHYLGVTLRKAGR